MISTINVKSCPDKFASACNRYFCNYCLKGSYQINVNLNNNKDELIENSKQKLDSQKNKIKAKTTLCKDWCCPWCLNDCFCSRCIREEQIFRLLSTYFYYEGDLSELYLKIISSNNILHRIKDHLIISHLEIRDTGLMERQCKVSKTNSSNNNLQLIKKSSEISQKMEIINKKEIRFDSKFEEYNDKFLKLNEVKESLGKICSLLCEKLNSSNNINSNNKDLKSEIESCIRVVSSKDYQILFPSVNLNRNNSSSLNGHVNEIKSIRLNRKGDKKMLGKKRKNN